ncbi:uncharacterized protein LOC123718833 [Pieris brassicae]|uniref:uncharacterized protein LOC123718833 n=1 Tax=Pieris brassicae TaxID=7116 RepID=UPI001E65E90E|nr:uncharacterized protein LOC123718833 [Pieris brassicae]
MDELLKTIKQRFSMENLIETIRDELDDTKKPETVQPNSVQPNSVQPNPIQPNPVQPNPVVNAQEVMAKTVENKTEMAEEPTVLDTMKSSNIQKKQPSTNTANVLQKPNPPDEDNDPYQENENLFSFCD